MKLFTIEKDKCLKIKLKNISFKEVLLGKVNKIGEDKKDEEIIQLRDENS